MMRVLFFFCLLLLACNRKPKVPEGILPPEKMQQVLWDLIRADALLLNPSHTDSLNASFQKRVTLYQQVVQMHGSSKEELERSLRFYEKRPDLLKIIFDSLQNKVDAPAPPVQRPDSARAAQ